MVVDVDAVRVKGVFGDVGEERGQLLRVLSRRNMYL